MAPRAVDMENTVRTIPWSRRTVTYTLLVLVVVECVVFVHFNVTENARFDLTKDFAAYYQPLWDIAHGILAPPQTVMEMPFLKDHLFIGLYLLAPILRFWHAPVALQVAQDLLIAIAQVGAGMWLISIAEQHVDDTRNRYVITMVGFVCLLLNPWTMNAAAYDFHQYALGLVFVTWSAYMLSRWRTRLGILLGILSVLGGDVTATYGVALGLMEAVREGGSRLAGLVVMAACLTFLLGVATLHANAGGTPEQLYGYLAGSVPPSSTVQLLSSIVRHPVLLMRALWAHLIDMWAVLSASGPLGLLGGAVAILPSLVLLENNLVGGYNFSTDFAQALPVYAFCAVGTVATLAWVARRSANGMRVLAAAIVMNSVAWSVVWYPRLTPRWVTTSTAAARGLAAVYRQVPGSSEVVADQANIGSFSGRRLVYPLYLQDIPVKAVPLVFVVSTLEGIQQLTSTQVAQRLRGISQMTGVHLSYMGGGVWEAVVARPRVRQVHFANVVSGPLPAWAFRTSTGAVVTQGREADWHMATSTDRSGYVVDGDYWPLQPGSYTAEVAVAGKGLVFFEVWNSSRDELVARRQLPLATRHREVVKVPFAISRDVNVRRIRGWGPFLLRVQEPVSGALPIMEIRVWTEGGVKVNVYSLAIQKGGGA